MPHIIPILIDTREQQPLAFPTVLRAGARAWTVTTDRATLPTADYSLDGHAGRTFPKNLHELAGICIERKADLDELALCFTAGRDRFEREFQRMQFFAVRILTVVGSRADVLASNYRSGMAPQALLASLDRWAEWYGVHVHFAASREEMADYILQAFRGYLERVERIEKAVQAEATTTPRRTTPPPPPWKGAPPIHA